MTPSLTILIIIAFALFPSCNSSNKTADSQDGNYTTGTKNLNDWDSAEWDTFNWDE